MPDWLVMTFGALGIVGFCFIAMVYAFASHYHRQSVLADLFNEGLLESELPDNFPEPTKELRRHTFAGSEHFGTKGGHPVVAKLEIPLHKARGKHIYFTNFFGQFTNGPLASNPGGADPTEYLLAQIDHLASAPRVAHEWRKNQWRSQLGWKVRQHESAAARRWHSWSDNDGSVGVAQRMLADLWRVHPGGRDVSYIAAGKGWVVIGYSADYRPRKFKKQLRSLIGRAEEIGRQMRECRQF